MNPMNLLKIKPLINAFKENHPKFPKFISAFGKAADAGTVIEIRLTPSNGKTIVSNLRLNEKDIELLKEFKRLKSQ